MRPRDSAGAGCPEKPDTARIYDRLCVMLLQADADSLCRLAPAVTEAIPELRPTVGFDQHSPHHAYDVFTHTAYVTAAVPRDLTLRWAALLHDIGKPDTFTRDASGRGHFYDHAAVGAAKADAILRRLEAPDALRERVVWLIGQHMTRLRPDPVLLRRFVLLYGQEAAEQLLTLQQADMNSKGTGEHTDDRVFDDIRQMLEQQIRKDQEV